MARPKNQFLCFVRRVPSHGNDAEVLLHCFSSSSEGVPVGLERGVGVEGVREGVGDGVGWGVIKQESDEAILNKSW